ncbi:unnamed protein product [Amoebophrya sp. A120]|nr:unnamed protein product [Amoebophrya sp. A120]|eukprot:GSA120T00013455001.1
MHHRHRGSCKTCMTSVRIFQTQTNEQLIALQRRNRFCFAPSIILFIAKVSGSGRIQTCDAHFRTQKNLSCIGSKSCPLSVTKMRDLSRGFGMAEVSRNL